MKNTFYFILTNWIFYWQIRFCKYYAFSLNQISDIREVWKCWPLRDDFCSISQKFYRIAILWWVNRNFFWEQTSKYCIVEFTASFVCWLLSWSFGKGATKKTQIFHIFKKLLFRNGQPYWYECWRVLRDFYGFSKRCGLQLFPKYSQSDVNLNVKSRSKFNCL